MQLDNVPRCYMNHLFSLRLPALSWVCCQDARSRSSAAANKVIRVSHKRLLEFPTGSLRVSETGAPWRPPVWYCSLGVYSHWTAGCHMWCLRNCNLMAVSAFQKLLLLWIAISYLHQSAGTPSDCIHASLCTSYFYLYLLIGWKGSICFQLRVFVSVSTELKRLVQLMVSCLNNIFRFKVVSVYEAGRSDLNLFVFVLLQL